MPPGVTRYPLQLLPSAGGRHRSRRHTVGTADVPACATCPGWRSGEDRLADDRYGIADPGGHRPWRQAPPAGLGPDAHLSSNWDKPGDEWGAGYIFAAPGCWDLRAIRGNATADVWIPVIARRT